MAFTEDFIVATSPQTQEPGKLQSIGLQKVGHDWLIECMNLFTAVNQIFIPGIFIF